MSAGKDLYQVLGVSSTASQAEVKKAYHKLALQLHPDKNVGNEEAKEKFQSLQQIYGILGNPERRKVYDDTGATDDAEGLNTNSFDELYQFYRGLYKEVTAEDIDSFETDYRGSEQEQGDLLTYYKQFTGNMTQVFEWLMCSHPSTDSHRFMDAIDGAIEAGEAKSSKAYRTWAADVKSRKRPKNPVIRKAKKQKSNDDDQALVRAIRDRSNGQAVLSALEEKYCQPKEKSMQRRSQR